MDAARLQRIQEIFHAVSESAPSERDAFLAEACKGDETLREQVVSLLAGVSSESGPFQRQAISLLAEAIDIDLSPGESLGPYRIESRLGEGGMGKVYKARDTRLRRIVALKISKFEFNQRFEREARAVAALNHPNICTLYDIGPNYLVMEFVDGVELKGPFPFAKAIDYACQILSALDAAHRKSIIHRDLKPANILVTKSGVKVLDFGLAKSAASEEELSAGNATTAITSEGTIAGTLHYMAPEQLQGGEIDTRADLFSFGCVLYEMLTGKRAFDGSNAASVIAAVMERPAPSVSKIAPISLDRALQHCLDKDRENRWQNARDLMLELQSQAEAPPPASRRRRERVLAVAAAGLLAAAGAWGWLRPRPAGTRPPALAFTISDPVPSSSRRPAIAPDGSYIVDGVLVRPLNSVKTEVAHNLLGGSTGIRGEPFWSPDSKWMAFPSIKQLLKVHMPDGAPEVIADLPGALRGGAWAADGSIIVAVTGGSGDLYLLPPEGKRFERLNVPDLKNGRISFPEFVAGGPDFLFLFQELDSDGEIYLARLENHKVGALKRIMKNQTAPHYDVEGGRLMFVSGDNLYAQELSLRKRSVIGEPELIQKGVASAPGMGLADFAVSRSGILAWRPGTAAASRLTAFDRDGNPTGMTGPPGEFIGVRMSPDESHILTLSAGGSSQLLGIGRPDLLKLGTIRWLAWSADGSRLFGSDNSRIFERLVSGEVEARPVAATPDILAVEDVSADGKVALYTTNRFSVYTVRLDAGLQTKPKPVVDTGELIYNPRFTPDGQSITYDVIAENQSLGIFIQPLGGPGLRRQIVESGRYAVWRGDGKEILYVDGTQIWSIPVSGPAGNPQFGEPRALFKIHPDSESVIGREFIAVLRDGSRIFYPQEIEQPQDSKVIQVRSGWEKRP